MRGNSWKRLLAGSFRLKLFLAILAAALIPMLLCSAVFLHSFRRQLEVREAAFAAACLESAGGKLDELTRAMTEMEEWLSAAPAFLNYMKQAPVEGGGDERAAAYEALFQAVRGFDRPLHLSVYDRTGRRQLSTISDSSDQPSILPENWGLLRAISAEREGVVRFFAPEQSDRREEGLRLGVRGKNGVFILVASVSESQLNAVFSGICGEQGQLFLLSPYWHPIYSSAPYGAETTAASLRKQLLSGRRLSGTDEETELRYTASRHPDSGLILIFQQPVYLSGAVLHLFYVAAAICALLGIAAAACLSLALSRQLFQPISALQRAMLAVSRNDLEVVIGSRRSDELGQLSCQFDHMVTALRENQQLLLEHERELNEVQIRMLQAQLNPHFLCNTLDTMKWISKINHMPKVAQMAVDLADILRFCIRTAAFVPLSDELVMLERYIDIQKIRLSGRFQFTTDVPKELFNCLVPKMLLQPLVENAILHGLAGRDKGSIKVRAVCCSPLAGALANKTVFFGQQSEGVGCGTQRGNLSVAAEAADRDLLITVEDDGCGLAPELTGRYRRSEGETGHLGLYNVDTILRIHYGEAYGVTLDNRKEGTGAIISARLPLRIKEEERVHAEGIDCGG